MGSDLTQSTPTPVAGEPQHAPVVDLPVEGEKEQNKWWACGLVKSIRFSVSLVASSEVFQLLFFFT